VVGCSDVAPCMNSCASLIAYGCGNASRTASQTLRLFACLTSDSASSSRYGRTVHRSSTSCIDYSLFELDTRSLHLAVRQQPDQRFVVKIDNLDAISPWIAKIAAERRLQFEFVFLRELLSNLFELRFIANHDPKMPHVGALRFFDFEDREKLMLTQFEES